MLYANTDDGSSALWVLDGNGVVVDNISYSIADRATILAQINEHYGTSFTGWSDNEIGLRIGDTVPNWNAYEKIQMPLEDGLYKFDYTGGRGTIFACMEVHNGNVDVYASSLESGDNINVYNPDGNYIAGNGIGAVLENISQTCSRYPNFVSVSRFVKDNSNLENWSEYTLLS